MNSLRMSFWMVPASWRGFTPCSSAATTLQGQDRQHRTVHGHGDAHLIQRDSFEQLPHIENRVDCDSRHSHVTGHTGIVGVIAAVCGQIESYGESFLAGGQVAAIEGVGFFGG